MPLFNYVDLVFKNTINTKLFMNINHYNCLQRVLYIH